jgi:hypothetical protein
MNFSVWAHYKARDRGYLLDRACELATKREMPLWQYRLAHPEARLSDAEIAALCDWTFAESARLSSTPEATPRSLRAGDGSGKP